MLTPDLYWPELVQLQDSAAAPDQLRSHSSRFDSFTKSLLFLYYIFHWGGRVWLQGDSFTKSLLFLYYSPHSESTVWLNGDSLY